MLKIGDFSRLAQIPIKTLRYYDDIGLLKPAAVDQFTGYRYYALDQLPRLNRIVALKDLGFSLEQITDLLDSHLNTAEVRALLRLKHLELQQQVEAAQARLTRLEVRLNQIESEDIMPAYEIVTKKVEPQRVLSIRQIVPTIPDRTYLLGEITTALTAHHLEAIAPRLIMYHHPGYRDVDLDIEVCIPINATAPDSLALPDGRQMTVRIIPAIPAALSVLSRGNERDLHQAYVAMNTYLHAHGHNYLGPAREIFLRESTDPAASMTELQYPIGAFTEDQTIDGIALPSSWEDVDSPPLPLSRRARTALEFASVEAGTLQQLEVHSTHLLLGLLRDRDGFAGEVLTKFGLSIERLRLQLQRGDTNIPNPTVSAAAREIITFANLEARQLGHDYLGTEHLLIGLLRQSDPVVLRLFTSASVNADQLRAAILRTFTR